MNAGTVNVSMYDSKEMSIVLDTNNIAYKKVNDPFSDTVMFYCEDQIEFAKNIANDFVSGMYWVKVPEKWVDEHETVMCLVHDFVCDVVRVKKNVFGQVSMLVAGRESDVLAFSHMLKNMS